MIGVHYLVAIIQNNNPTKICNIVRYLQKQLTCLKVVGNSGSKNFRKVKKIKEKENLNIKINLEILSNLKVKRKSMKKY